MKTAIHYTNISEPSHPGLEIRVRALALHHLERHLSSFNPELIQLHAELEKGTHHTSDLGKQRQVPLCDEHYAEVAGNRGFGVSPLESLFHGGGGLFDRFFNDSWPSFEDTGAARPASQSGRRGRSREAVDLQSFLSEAAVERLQAAANKAVEFGKNEVDTEHLLLALADSDVVQEILREFKLSSADLKTNIEENAPRGKRKPEPEAGPVEVVGVSPRAKSALEHALDASRELGHSYVGPDHILIGLVEEEDGFAGEALRKYGLSSQALRQKVVKVVGKGAEEGKVARRSSTPILDKHARDLTALARAGKLDPVIGRAKEIETTIE